MGCGKTTAMINMMKEDSENRYIFVTPYLNEVTRIKEDTEYRFKEPVHLGFGKLDSLHHLLSSGYDIATTHSLFLMATPDTIQLIHEGGYTLVLDEVLDIIKDYNDATCIIANKIVTREDVRWLQQEGHIQVSADDYRVSWVGASVDDFHFSEVERLAKNGSLRCINENLYWEYPIDVFQAFKRVFIMTYRFEYSILASYLNVYGLSYTKVSVAKESGKFHLCPYVDDIEQKRTLVSLLNIYSGRLNQIGDRRNAFSVSWIERLDTDRIHRIKNNMRAYKEQIKAVSCDILWTTAKANDFYTKLERVPGFKYIHRLTAEEKALSDTSPEKKKLKCFLSCTERATNQYKGRTTLLYLINRFLHPDIGNYFKHRGSPINEDEWATNEMLQWIWRSAIRDGKLFFTRA